MEIIMKMIPMILTLALFGILAYVAVVGSKEE